MEKVRNRTLKWWQFHHSLWRYKFVVLAIMVLGVFLTALYTSSIPKEYRATASAMIDSFSAGSQDYVSPNTADLSRAHKVLAEKQKVKEEACEQSHLPPRDYALSRFEARVDGVLIYFNITDGNYEVARQLANAWRKVFIKEVQDRVTTSGQREITALNAELKKYDGELTEAEAKKAKFFEKNQSFDPSRFQTDPIHQVVANYEFKMRQADDQAATLEKELKVIEDPANSPVMFTVLQHVATNTIFLGRVQKIKDYEAALAETKIKFREGAETADAAAQLNQAKAVLESSRQELLAQLKLQLDVVQSERAAAKERYKESKDRLDEIIKLMNEYGGITASIDGIKRSIEFVKERRRDTNLAQSTSHNNVVEWEEASVMEHPVPVRPSWRQNITMGFILSFLLACGLVFGLEQIDDTVRTPRDLEQRLGATVVGSVPACGRTSMSREGYFLAQRQAASIAVDSLRGVHIALEVNRKATEHNGAMIITITSAVPQDGKSFVTSNLGILFASLGRKVLVVDADLRKASLSKALQAEDRNGFFEIVKNQKWTREFAMNGTTPGYYLLAAGHIQESTSESLHPENVGRLIEQMRKDFDVIIFDTPPVLALPDACVLGQLSDVTVLVTRSRHTRMAQAERAASTLLGAKVKELVFVVNGVQAIDAANETYGAGYGYGYGYGYGKGYGYGVDEKKAAAKPRAKQSAAEEDEDDEE